MKVAVLSPESMSGKSTLAAILGGVYAHSQGKICAVLSTGDLVDNTEIAQTDFIKNDASNPYIFKSMLASAQKNDQSLFDYGIRMGGENVFFFDILSAKMDEVDKEETFYDCIKKVPADLTIVEICGDWKSDFNQECMKLCDCYLVLFTHSHKSFRILKKFREEQTEDFLSRAAFVCSKYNPAVISEKALSASVGIPIANLFGFPHNVAIQSYAMKSQIDKLAYSIIVADYEVQNVRMKIMEMMQFIFDSSDRKVIKEIAKWFR